MHIWIIVVDLGLAVLSFVCGAIVAYLAWYASANVALDDEHPVRRRISVLLWVGLVSLMLFAVGLYDLRQLARHRFVPWDFAAAQVAFLGLFAFFALWFAFAFRRHARAQALVEQGRTGEAIELIEGWIRSARKPDASLHSMLGMIHLNTGHSELAVVEFRRAVEISQESPAHLCNLAVALDKVGQTDDALGLLELAERKAPAGRGVYVHNRCFFLAQAGRIEEARALLPDVERYHQQLTNLPPLQQRQMMETLSKIHHLCGQPPADSRSA